ncbi:MAG TPA: amidohydrolase family protein [Streptosporangiaceae bacterium]|nr:amidohydrolase family protein [Streptosporangiaceae bacterium]
MAPGGDHVNRPGSLLVTNGEVGGQPGLDVRVSTGLIRGVGPGLARHPGEAVLDAAGGAVIPGLHDHHVHLRALTARRVCLDVSGAPGPQAFDHALTDAAGKLEPGRTLRVTGWSEHSAGELDRVRLDTLTGSVPARVQHRSGAMWVLNSAALRLAGVADSGHEGIERDDRGEPTGRLLRMDGWLRERLPAGLPENWFAAGLASFAQQSARRGITGFTDATPDRDQGDVDDFEALAARGIVMQRLTLMAPPGLREPAQAGMARVRLGPQKIIMDDAALPDPAELTDRVRQAHHRDSRVAIHCVTAEQLIVAVEALEAAGTTRSAGPPGPPRSAGPAALARPAGDRIEHAGVVPPGYAVRLARLGVAVVTQPGFVAARGDDYLRGVCPPERDWLYPCASLIRAGVPVAAGTDAPFGPSDPWHCVASAIARRTPAGVVLGPDERVSARRALSMFTAAAHDPAQARTVAPGQPGDLCVLRAPLRTVLAAPAAGWVRATIIGGCVFPAS